MAFDFDGTLTVRDSFNAFLYWRAGLVGTTIGRLRLLPEVIAFFAHRDRARLKAAMVKIFLAGAVVTAVEEDARRYADTHAPRLLRPDALACWADWRGRGARLVIVSASPEFLLKPFAEPLGAQRVLGTRLACDPNGRFTGLLAGANCRGAEKVTRLKAAFGEDLDLVAAYGDSDGDIEMLASAREGHMKVFTARP